MKRTFIIVPVIFLLISANLFGQISTGKSLVKLDFNWPKFLSQQDLIWDTMPADYFAGPFGVSGMYISYRVQVPNTLYSREC